MRAKLLSWFSPDIDDPATFKPDDPRDFGYLLTLTVGVDGVAGDEVFYVMVCTPDWIRANYSDASFVIGHHHLVIQDPSESGVVDFVRTYIEQCEADSWQDLMARVGKIARSEFDIDPVLDEFGPKIRSK